MNKLLNRANYVSWNRYVKVFGIFAKYLMV